ncbi:MAG TPA: DUF4184 family protein [Longimicrobiaceae bacterium]|nr:DUF4184 family protein [Longimicrobiaceae bacterium]
MPLTPSHAAAALLLRRLSSRLPLAPLVIGTLSPDFEYLLRLAPRGRLAHSPAGLILFCLPASLVVWVAYRAWVRPALLDLLPPALAAENGPRPTPLFAAGCAALLGAASHAAWDGFTHASGFGVLFFSGLRGPVAPALAADLRWYKLLQHGSTLVGGFALLIAAFRFTRRLPPPARRFAPGQVQRVIRASTAILGAAMLAGIINGSRGLAGGVANALGFAAVGGMLGFALALLVYSLREASRVETPS